MLNLDTISKQHSLYQFKDHVLNARSVNNIHKLPNPSDHLRNEIFYLAELFSYRDLFEICVYLIRTHMHAFANSKYKRPLSIQSSN